jgi:hypothetical protein
LAIVAALAMGCDGLLKHGEILDRRAPPGTPWDEPGGASGTPSETGGAGPGGDVGAAGGTVFGGSGGDAGVAGVDAGGAGGAMGGEGGSDDNGGAGGDGSDCVPPLDDVYVAADGSSLASGCDPLDPIADLETALERVDQGGTIHVQAGGFLVEQLVIDKNLTLLGSYYGSVPHGFALRDPLREVTSITSTAPATLLVPVPVTVRIDGLIIFNDSVEDEGYAVWLQSGGAEIEHCILYGSTRSRESVGLRVDPGAGARVLRSTLVGRYASLSSAGIYSWGRVSVDTSTVVGGPASANSFGAVFLNGGSEVAANSVFQSAPAAVSIGVQLSATSTFNLVNNTIGAEGSMKSIAVQSFGRVNVTNNILFTVGGQERICFDGPDVDGPDSEPPSFQNNLLFDCPDGLYRAAGGTLDAIEEVNALDGQTVEISSSEPVEHARFSGNVSFSGTMNDLFIDFDGPDDGFATSFDNDFHLITSDVSLISGGLDARTGPCGTHETPTPCGGTAWDHSGIETRTVPFSIGAYEKD